MPSYGLLTNPSNDIINEISKIHELNFEHAEIGIDLSFQFTFAVVGYL
jgi:hypothetical protein